MSFRALAQDYSKLPKVRTHAQLGRVGDVNSVCSWNPLDWPNCINIFRNARKEFQENYTKILQMENSYIVALQQLNQQPQSVGRDDLINQTQQRASEAAEARRQGIAVANALEAEIAGWNWIPGFDTVFLNGLPGLRGLGIVPLLVPVSTPMLIMISISGAVAVISLAYIIGSLADSWRATENVNIAAHNAWGKCLEAFDSAVKAGVTPPVCGDKPDTQDWTTIALIGGSVVLAVMLLGRK